MSFLAQKYKDTYIPYTKVRKNVHVCVSQYAILIDINFFGSLEAVGDLECH